MEKVKEIQNKITSNNLKKYIAVYLLMGAIKLPEIELYWSKNELFHVPIFSKIMSEDFSF